MYVRNVLDACIYGMHVCMYVWHVHVYTEWYMYEMYVCTKCEMYIRNIGMYEMYVCMYV